jgi:hypothetical protein
MKDVVGSTSEEVRMIKAIQRSVGAMDNGYVGNQTMSEIAAALGAGCFPLNVELYGQPAIIARDIEPLNPKGPLPSNAISGSFSDGYQPCSVLIQDGKAICWSACHYPTPETVIYRTKDGKVYCKRVSHVSDDLPLADVRWAVGGMGLLGNYGPTAEGFTGRFSDVLRRTDHTMLGYKDGMLYGVYCKAMTARQVNAFARDKLKLDMAIMLDGGHIAAINAACNKINTKQRQLYAVRFL